MKKQVVFLVFLVMLLPVSGQEAGVSFNLEAPENVTAGESFEVELIFRKGDLEDYSRFSQDLPEGFAAANISSPNADFTFTDQRVRIIWLKLPDEEEIHVKYTISVDQRLSGQLELKGTFAYVVNGERAYLNLPNPERINILPNPDLDPSQVVDISEFPEMIRRAETKPAETGAFSTVIRQQPVKEPNGIVNITLLIKTPEGTSFLKLEESIPGGYSFESVDADGAVVSQAASLARFVWMRAPQKSLFTIRYRLIPILEENQQPLDIQGNLSYTEDGATKVVKPKQVDVNLASLDNASRLALLETGQVRSGNTSGSTTGNSGQADRQTNTENTTRQPDNTNGTASTVAPASQPSYVNGVKVLQPPRGIVFRIQVSAVRYPGDDGSYFGDSPLLQDLRVENTDGWYKYTVGPASSYIEAEKMKDRINAETLVKDAFVVVYRDGRRVPVEDVL